MLPSTSRYIFSITLEKYDPTLIDSGIIYDTGRAIETYQCCHPDQEWQIYVKSYSREKIISAECQTQIDQILRSDRCLFEDSHASLRYATLGFTWIWHYLKLIVSRNLLLNPENIHHNIIQKKFMVQLITMSHIIGSTVLCISSIRLENCAPQECSPSV